MKNSLLGVILFMSFFFLAEAVPTETSLQAHIEKCQKEIANYSQKVAELQKKILMREQDELIPLRTQAIEEGLNWSDRDARRNWLEENKIRERSIPGIGKNGERHLIDNMSQAWLDEINNLIKKNIKPLQNRIASCNHGIYCIRFISQNQQIITDINQRLQIKPGNSTWDEKNKKWVQGPMTRGNITPQEAALKREYDNCLHFLHTDSLMKSL